MKKAVFKPTWNDFDLPTVSETVGVNIHAPVVIRATVMLDPGETQIAIDYDDAIAVTRLFKNGIEEVAFHIEDEVLTVTQTSTEVSLIEIERSGSIEYSVYAGQIVPGIALSQTGRLKGIVANIPYKQEHSYRFGLRAKWGRKVADVVKQWVATPVDNQLSWNTDTLPTAQVDPAKISGRPFYTLGEFRRGQIVEIGIDVYNPDFTPIVVSMRQVPEMVPGENHYNGSLPLGLQISNNPFQIGGFIPAEAKVGDYFVELFVDEPEGPTPIIIHAKLLGDQFDKFTAVNRLSWSTDAHLGEIKEGHAATFAVKVVNSNGNAVTYRLAPGSRPLPSGMTLTQSGEVQGLAPHASSDTNYEFTVKASSDVYVASKTFSFRLLKTFLEPRHLTVSLPFSGPIRRTWKTYGEAIPLYRKFRPADPFFGASEPSILVLDGLRALTIYSLDYDRPFDLIAGAFKVAKLENSGSHICDVIYREFFDPMNRAGGFVAGNREVIESPVYYPQDPSRRINEPTINNIRSDLVIKIGLNSENNRSTLGLNSGELLPEWMMTSQINGSPLGYLTACVVDYVQAGKGEAIIRTLDYGQMPIGSSVRFDRLLVSEGPVAYYHYLGWAGKNEESSYQNPLSPTGIRVDGIDPQDNRTTHNEPVVTWLSSQTEVTFNVRLYNGETLLRTETGLNNSSFAYTASMQAEDDNPGHIRVEVASAHDERESPPASVEITIRVGWGYGWGLRYGGAA